VARTRLALAEGDAGLALDRADDLGRRLARVAPSPTCIPWRSLRAEALDRLGRADEAVAAARGEVDAARAVGAPGALGRALRVLGTALRDDGLDVLDEAVRVLDPSTARLELAKALAARGAALRRVRRPTEAREPLRRALELASVLGADPLAEQARGELHAAGARPRADVGSGVGALTASERRVVDLAAEGSSNREIAQALYVTPKTVEVHLSNAYRKLGIRSRRELGGVLAKA
jgi:DNA-binding NarL/FixJ family response regulator